MLGVFLPTALTVVGKMQEAAGHIDIEEARNHLGDVVRVSGRGKFVRDRIDLFFFTRALDHRVDEAWSIRTEHPRDPNNKLLISASQNIFYPCPFRFAIDADWLGSVGFDVRLALFAVENVVGADMNQLGVFLAANFAEHLWRFRVDRKSLFALRFTKINIRKRGRVDQNVEI